MTLEQIEKETFSSEMEVMTTRNTYSRLLSRLVACNTDDQQPRVEGKPPLLSLFGCFPSSSTSWYKHLPCSPWAIESMAEAA